MGTIFENRGGSIRAARHLEISNKLQDGTMELTDLKGQLMTLRIALQDRLAELTLEDEASEGEADKVASK